MKKLEEKWLELEVLEVALVALYGRKKLVEDEVEAYKENREKSDYFYGYYELVMTVKKYNELIEKLEEML